MKVTQARGSADTLGAPWALVESGLRPIVITFCVAFCVHFVPPMIPVQSMLSWLGMWIGRADDDEGEVPQQEVVVPIDLDMFYDEQAKQDGVDIAPEETAPPVPEPADEELIVAPDPQPEEKAAPPPKPAPEPEPPEPEDAPKPQAKQKLRLKGAFEEAGDNNVARADDPNVNIYIAAQELRKRDLAPMFGDLLSAVPEWQLLLGGTNIDPVADFDHVLISAPHMKKKGRWIVARVQYNIDDAKMKSAIGTAADRTKGKWLDDYQLPVASVDNNTRRVVLIENQHQLVVLPEGAEKKIPTLEGVRRFPEKPTAGIFLDMVTPANAFKSKFPFPTSIERLTLRLSLVGSDGYLVELEMIDADEESAKKNAAFLDTELEKVRPIPVVSLFTKKYFIGKPDWETEENIIRAKVPVSRAQVGRIIKLVKVWLEGREARANEKRSAKKAKAVPKTRRPRMAPVERKETKPPAKPKPSGLFDGMRDRLDGQ